LKKISFGVFLPFYAFKFNERRTSAPFDRIENVVQECERLGYDSIWLDDHLFYGKQPVFECWTTLSALSSSTAKIRLGTMVLCSSFRNPALLAKMAATFDVISNGRLEFGIGVGIQKDEHDAYGIPFLKPSERVDRMKEVVEIIKKMWTEEKTSYRGRFYRTNDAICEPKPLQKPHPPLIIAGGGEKLTLKVVAQYADRFDWGYIPSFELYNHKIDALKSHCKAVGRNFEEIEKSCWLGGQIYIAQNQKDLSERILFWKPESVSLEDFKKLNLVGAPDVFVKKIRQYRNFGVTYFMLFFGDLPDLEGVKLFADKVINKLHSVG
jgi:F420-dependent oxidoreductase-like protein